MWARDYVEADHPGRDFVLGGSGALAVLAVNAVAGLVRARFRGHAVVATARADVFLVVALVMHRVIVKVLKNGSTEPSDHE